MEAKRKSVRILQYERKIVAHGACRSLRYGVASELNVRHPLIPIAYEIAVTPALRLSVLLPPNAASGGLASMARFQA